MTAVSSDTVVRMDALPLHEIRLFHNHTLSPPSSRAFDKKTKIHQIKLQQTQVSGRGIASFSGPPLLSLLLLYSNIIGGSY